MLRTRNVTSFSIAVVIMIRLLSVVALSGFRSNLLNYLFLSILFISTGLCFFLNNKQFNKNINRLLFAFLLFVILMYCIHSMMGEAQITILELLLYCMIPLMLSILNFDEELVLRYILYLSLCSIPVINRILEYEYVSLQQVDMAVAYSLFVGVSACIIHFLFYKNKKNILIYFSYIYNIYIIVRLIFVGNRGIYLSFAALILFCQITYIRGREYSKKKKRILKCVLIFELIAFVIVINNLNSIVLEIYNSLTGTGKNVPSFFIKMRRQILSGDVSNGRASGYLDLIGLIFRNPFGYGMESTYRITNGIYAYPHNFLLQFWIEFGIIFGTIFNIITCLPIYVWLSKKIDSTKYKKNFLLFLIVITIPKMFVSGDIWMQPQFWFLFGIGMYYCSTSFFGCKKSKYSTHMSYK